MKRVLKCCVYSYFPLSFSENSSGIRNWSLQKQTHSYLLRDLLKSEVFFTHRFNPTFSSLSCTFPLWWMHFIFLLSGRAPSMMKVGKSDILAPWRNSQFWVSFAVHFSVMKMLIFFQSRVKKVRYMFAELNILLITGRKEIEV